MAELSPRQQRFVEEYIKDLNATQAAIRAGYSARTAGKKGPELLKKQHVAQAITEAKATRTERTLVTADYVVTNLRRIAERCMERRPVLDSKGEQIIGEDGKPAWTFDSKGATRALELLGKHIGIFTDKVEVSGALDMNALEAGRKRAYGDAGY